MWGGYPLEGCLWLATRGTPHELYWLDRYLWLTTRGTPLGGDGQVGYPLE